MATDSLNHPSARNSKKNKNKKHRNWKQTDDGNGLKLKTVVQRIALKLYSPQTQQRFPRAIETTWRDRRTRRRTQKTAKQMKQRTIRGLMNLLWTMKNL